MRKPPARPRADDHRLPRPNGRPAKTGTVNLLGQRMGSFETTELARVLREAGVGIGMQLPCGCTVEDIRNAASARVNIVVNAIALPLAEKMQERFGTPYVFFDKSTDPDRIYAT